MNRSPITGPGFRLATLFGIPISINWTWAPIALLVLFGLVESLGGGLSGLMFGLMGTGLLFGSILMHELGHALAARRYGIRTHGITLHLLGGVAQIESEPKTPTQEIVIALAGPAVSLALAGTFTLAWTLASAIGLPVAAVALAGYLAVLNGVLGVFNLLPGLPLDGGRIFRAISWHRSGDRDAATVSAARGGEVVGWCLIALGVLLFVASIASGRPGDGVMMALAGWFILSAARVELGRVDAATPRWMPWGIAQRVGQWNWRGAMARRRWWSD